MRGQPLRIQQVYDAIDEYIRSLPEGTSVTQGDANIMLGKKDLAASGATISKSFQMNAANGHLVQVTRQLFRRTKPQATPLPNTEEEPLHYGFKDRLEFLESEVKFLQSRLVRVEKRLGIE